MSMDPIVFEVGYEAFGYLLGRYWDLYDYTFHTAWMGREISHQALARLYNTASVFMVVAMLIGIALLAIRWYEAKAYAQSPGIRSKGLHRPIASKGAAMKRLDDAFAQDKGDRRRERDGDN